MNQLTRLCLLATVFVFVSAYVSFWPAAAKPRSIKNCEKITDDDAYNKCLASFGPKRGASRSRKGARPAARAGKRYRGTRGITRRRGIRTYRSRGRVRTIISVPRR